MCLLDMPKLWDYSIIDEQELENEAVRHLEQVPQTLS